MYNLRLHNTLSNKKKTIYHSLTPMTSSNMYHILYTVLYTVLFMVYYCALFCNILYSFSTSYRYAMYINKLYSIQICSVLFFSILQFFPV